MNRAPDARTKTTVDPFLVARYKEGNKIIGVDGARDEIIAKLCEGDDASKLQLKILSIVGFGGLGKTTLAKAVYDSLEIPFDCRAFVSVSRIFNAMEVFKDIFCQLDGQKYKNLNIAELFTESQLIDALRQLLQERRYASRTSYIMTCWSGYHPVSGNANLAAPWPTGHASTVQNRRDVYSLDTSVLALSTS
jgi:disease resistance protein RPM1